MINDSVRSTILITGANGQLGYNLVKNLSDKYNVVGVDIEDFDISEFTPTKDFIVNTKPGIIIHTAAFTDVDGCEMLQEKAFKVNGLGTRNISIAAKYVDATLFYISTDYVFNGKKDSPYYEYDSLKPISVYGKSKLLGEEFVKEQLNNFFIIRIAWLYGENGNNFIKTMIKLAETKDKIQVVNDQYGSPTWTEDVAEQISKLISSELYGTYHCTSQGSCTWFEYALEIFKEVGYKAEVAPNGSVRLNPRTYNTEPRTQNPESNTQNLRPITLKAVSSEEFKRPARRPKNSVLENYMLQLQGLDIMPHWKKFLKRYLNPKSGIRNLEPNIQSATPNAINSINSMNPTNPTNPI